MPLRYTQSDLPALGLMVGIGMVIYGISYGSLPAFFLGLGACIFGIYRLVIETKENRKK